MICRPTSPGADQASPLRAALCRRLACRTGRYRAGALFRRGPEVVAGEDQHRTSCAVRDGSERLAATQTERTAGERAHTRAFERAVLPRRGRSRIRRGPSGPSRGPSARPTAAPAAAGSRRRRTAPASRRCPVAAEVAVDLERRVGVEHVRIGPLGARAGTSGSRRRDRRRPGAPTG